MSTIRVTLNGQDYDADLSGLSIAIGMPPATEPPPVIDYAPVVAAFTVQVDGNVVTIHDATTGATAESWDYDGDGTVDGEVFGDHTRIYSTAGTFPLRLIATGPGGESRCTQMVTIVLPEAPPVVEAPEEGLTGQPVTLTGTLADSTVINLTANPGDKLDLDPARPQLGRLHYYADGLCVRIEAGYHDVPADLVGDFTLTVAGQQLWSGPLTIWARGNTRPFWLAQPKVRADANLSKFPTYGPGSTGASMYDKYMKSDNSPTGIGPYSPAFSTTGERMDLGPLDQASACFMVNPSAENAAVVLGMADAASVFPYHCVNRATGDLYDLSGNPKVSMLDAMIGVSGNPIVKPKTACRLDMTQAQAHATMFCALAAELFATAYHKEELAAWANYVFSLSQNWGYRISGVGCYAPTHGQVRGKGRGLDALLYASELSDRPDYFRAWVKAYADACAKLYLVQAGLAIDQLGIIYDSGKGYGPYQQHLLIYAMGHALQYGYTEYQPLLDYFATPLIDAILTDHEVASAYSVIVKDAAGMVAPTWADALRLNPDLAVGLALPEGSQERIDALHPGDTTYRAGDFDGYPTSPTGFPAIMQPALAVVARYATDQPQAQAAWAKFMQYARCGYSVNPKYNVVP